VFQREMLAWLGATDFLPRIRGVFEPQMNRDLHGYSQCWFVLSTWCDPVDVGLTRSREATKPRRGHALRSHG